MGAKGIVELSKHFIGKKAESKRNPQPRESKKSERTKGLAINAVRRILSISGYGACNELRIILSRDDDQRWVDGKGWRMWCSGIRQK